ncbi:hypothetical protein N3K66_001115 [Trichothecium roseum]|uniref:Uncharacterized protein n=1 Tax=Trichothecium roseum TaxID=47278 RepID=A0ACC0VDQ3_9HYPO|nr:hypothetical protein N3K66_001115 [Trichothecium roseum]
MPLESVHSRIWNAFPGHDLPVTPEFLFRPAPDQAPPSNVPYMRAGVASVDGRPFRGAESEILRGPLTIQGTAHDPQQGSWTFEFKDLGFQRGTEGGKYVLEFALHLDGGKVAATLALPDIGILSLGKAK